jgi:hypothetical protein
MLPAIQHRVIFTLLVLCTLAQASPVKSRKEHTWNLNNVYVEGQSSDSEQEANHGSTIMSNQDHSVAPSSQSTTTNVQASPSTRVGPQSRLPRVSVDYARFRTVPRFERRVDAFLANHGSSNTDASSSDASASGVTAKQTLDKEGLRELENIKHSFSKTLAELNRPQFALEHQKLQVLRKKLPDMRYHGTLDPEMKRQQRLIAQRATTKAVRLRKKLGVTAVPYQKPGRKPKMDDAPDNIKRRRERKNAMYQRRRDARKGKAVGIPITGNGV